MAGLLNSFQESGAGLLNSLGEEFTKDKVMAFLSSPEAAGLASGLLGSSSFSEGFGTGLKNMEEFGLKRAEAGDWREKAKLKQLQNRLVSSLLGDGDSGGEGSSLSSKLSSEQKQRLLLAYGLGGPEAAARVATEQDPTLVPTTSTITNTQEQLRSIDAAIPALERLKELDQPDIKPIPGGSLLSSLTNPTKTGVARKAIKDIAKDYLSAKQTNITDSSIKAAVDVLSKAPGETQEQYNERIDGIIEDLESKRSYASSVVKPVRPVERKSKPKASITKNKNAKEYTDEELWAIVNRGK